MLILLQGGGFLGCLVATDEVAVIKFGIPHLFACIVEVDDVPVPEEVEVVVGLELKPTVFKPLHVTAVGNVDAAALLEAVSLAGHFLDLAFGSPPPHEDGISRDP